MISLLFKIAILFILISFFKRIFTGTSKKPLDNMNTKERVDTNKMNVKDASFSEIDEDS